MKGLSFPLVSRRGVFEKQMRFTLRGFSVFHFRLGLT